MEGDERENAGDDGAAGRRQKERWKEVDGGGSDRLPYEKPHPSSINDFMGRRRSRRH